MTPPAVPPTITVFEYANPEPDALVAVTLTRIGTPRAVLGTVNGLPEPRPHQLPEPEKYSPCQA